MKTLILCLLITSQAMAAISANSAWEVRPTVGDDTNGCGFVAGASGTDYSQQDAKNTAGNNISTTDAVANGTTTLTSATASFTSAIVGNIIYLQGGTGALTNVRRQVVTFTNSTTIVLDATVATGTGITMNIGGACAGIASPGPLLDFVASNAIFVKATGTLSVAAATTLTDAVTTTSTAPPNRLEGYTTTRGDGGKFTMLATAGSFTVLTAPSTVNGWFIRNIIIDCDAQTGCRALQLAGQSMLDNAKLMDFLVDGVLIVFDNPYTIIRRTEITGGQAGCSAGVNNGATVGTVIEWNWVHDNACPGISVINGRRGFILNNLVTNNSGVTSTGIDLGNSQGLVVYGNTVSKSGLHGISSANAIMRGTTIRNNLLVENGTSGTGCGLSNTVAGTAAWPQYDGNAYFDNDDGERCNIDDTGAVNAINGVAPYTNVFDVILSVNPFTNAAGNDFTLNNTAGGGAALRGTGVPGVFPGAGGTGYQTFGALVPDPGAASTPCAFACIQ